LLRDWLRELGIVFDEIPFAVRPQSRRISARDAPHFRIPRSLARADAPGLLCSGVDGHRIARIEKHRPAQVRYSPIEGENHDSEDVTCNYLCPRPGSG